jgi:hypothetical protein
LGSEDRRGARSMINPSPRFSTAPQAIYITVDIALPPLDHECGPDCLCWTYKKDLTKLLDERTV